MIVNTSADSGHLLQSTTSHHSPHHSYPPEGKLFRHTQHVFPPARPQADITSTNSNGKIYTQSYMNGLNMSTTSNIKETMSSQTPSKPIVGQQFNSILSESKTP